ncbi:MAG: molybdate ABC transporter substrate-binding protein [Spirochaetaceae bacterium]|jgi:molybdate transport system substrate-binding protein|nr:molybdate ABC transporter substrate-binding protein [Spirochaetaceae bacterium]
MRNTFCGTSRAAALAIAAVFVLGGQSLLFAGAKKEAAGKAQDLQPVELHLYAGAGLRTPAEIIIENFESATGNTVSVEWAGMGQLLTRFQTTNVGDVFLSGAESYVDEIANEGKVLLEKKLVYHTAVMAVRRDKAEGINNFADLAKSNLRLAVGDPEAIALGKSGEMMLEKSGFADELRKKIITRATTGPQLSMYLLNGDVDAAIIGRGDAVKNSDKLVILPVPPGIPQEISAIASLSTSEHPDIANQLVEWFAKPESIAIFVNEGYLPLE